MAKWIQGAISHPGRIRNALGLKEGEAVTGAKLDELHAKLTKEGKMNKSWAGAIGLARRFISKKGV